MIVTAGRTHRTFNERRNERRFKRVRFRELRVFWSKGRDAVPENASARSYNAKSTRNVSKETANKKHRSKEAKKQLHGLVAQIAHAYRKGGVP